MKDYPIQTVAFHGTYETAANQIVASQTFHKGTKRPDHWLGQGAYFFREDESQAMVWATYKVKNTPQLSGEEAVVIVSEIHVNAKQYLNLDTRDGLEVLDKLVNQIHGEFKQQKIQVQVEDPILLRCIYCDQLPSEIKVIQRTFPVDSRYDDQPILKSMGICLNGVQMCVRDLDVITKGSIEIVSRRKVYSSPQVKKSKRNRPRTME